MGAQQVNSEARQRFVRAANTRTNNALDALRKVGKLNSERYEYGPEDVRTILGLLQRALDDVQEQLSRRDREEPHRITVIEE